MNDVIRLGEKKLNETKDFFEKQHPVVEMGAGLGLIIISLPIPAIDPLDIAGAGLIVHSIHRIRKSGTF